MSNFLVVDEGEVVIKVGILICVLIFLGGGIIWCYKWYKLGFEVIVYLVIIWVVFFVVFVNKCGKKKYFKIFKFNVIIKNYFIREREKKMLCFFCINIF